MHVAVIAPEFPPDLGGVETYSVQFTRELARRGHRVTVFTVRHSEGELSLPGVRVVPGLALCRNLDRALFRDCRADAWQVMNAAYSWVAEELGNVVVSIHGNDFLRPYYPVARPGLSRLPGLWRLEARLAPLESWLGNLFTPALMRRSLPRARHILSNSRYTERVFLERFPECLGKTSTALVGVAAEFFQVARGERPAGGPVRLCTVCRLSEPRKNVELVLRALALLKERCNFRYTVVGDGHLRPGLEELCRELGLQQRVSFAGVLPFSGITELLASSDLFVLTSALQPGSHEGFGIAYLEANACGTPVLAARLAGAVEAVEEGVSGYFADDLSVPALAATLERFLTGELSFDPAACRSFARRFSWAAVVDQALAHYPAGAAAPQSGAGTLATA